MPLPRFFALKSNFNNKYLRFKHEDDEATHAFLQFSEENLLSPYTKFEAETANSDAKLLHLRSCYNNKYLLWSEEYWITGKGDQANEDQENFDCTLFKPVRVGPDDSTIQFWHVYLKGYASLNDASPPLDACLCVRPNNPHPDNCCVFTIIDLEPWLIFPKHVAFKGDNGEYLSARLIEGHQYLQFSSWEIDDPTVANEVLYNPDGSICIKSTHFGQFWRRSPNWILADSDDTVSDNPDVLFRPVKLENAMIALRNLGSNNFCQRVDKTDFLAASFSTITRSTELTVEELVIARKIYDVKFHLEDVRIYNQTVIKLTDQVVFNKTEESITEELKVSYSKTRSSTWKNSISFKSPAVKTTIKTGVPNIVDGKVEIMEDFEGEYNWGETMDLTAHVETKFKISVPAMTKVIVKLIGITSSCDVPFSYVQRDHCVDGVIVIDHMDDGIYTGIYYCNLNFEIQEEKLGNGKNKNHVSVID